jgi:hypothetical protein
MIGEKPIMRSRRIPCMYAALEASKGVSIHSAGGALAQPGLKYSTARSQRKKG